LEAGFEVHIAPASVILILSWPHFRVPGTDRRRDMTGSMFKVGLPLTLALAIVSGTVFAQEKDRTSEITIQGKHVQVTKTVERSYSGEPIDRYTFTTPVNVDNLDLSTPAGVAQLKKRVVEAAVCGQAVAEHRDHYEWIAPEVTLALSALTTITTLEHEGYVLMPL
jgi:UrcA family protein